MSLAFPVPSGWRQSTVGQIASIITGPFGTLLKASEYGGADGVPLISVGEIREGFLRVTEETPTVSGMVTNRLPQYLLKEGDIVFGRKGGVERSAIIKRHQVGWFLGSDGISIRLKENCHRPFFGHALRSKAVQSWLLQNASGTTMPSLNQRILGAVALSFPEDLKEQKAIAEALSDADALIEGLERLIAKKRLIKQGAMQDLLAAKRRLPGFSGEWVERKLGALLPVRHGRSQKDVESRSGPYPILASGGQIGTAASFLWNKPSVLIGRKGTIDRPQFIEVPFWTVDTLFYTDIVAPNDPRFLFYVFQRIDWQSYNEASGVPSLNAKTIESIDVVVPDAPEQIAISAVLKDMDVEIQALEIRLEKARQVKEGMMQNLLTGRIRLV